jgi:hypothetical protein
MKDAKRGVIVLGVIIVVSLLIALQISAFTATRAR